METEVLETVEDGVAIITLNRPDVLNALDVKMMRALLDATRRVADDAAIGCVVLTGAGRGFCAGGDTKASNAAAKAIASGEMEGRRADFEARRAWLRRSMEAARLLHQMAKPTIAMINGPCAGAGLSLAGACDLRFAADNAVFASAFTAMGLSGDYGGSWFWTRILGTAKARELFLLAEKIQADEALNMGLVSRVWPQAELRARTMEIARKFAAGPRAGYAYAKSNLNAAETAALEQLLDLEATTMLLSRQALSAHKPPQG